MAGSLRVGKLCFQPPEPRWLKAWDQPEPQDAFSCEGGPFSQQTAAVLGHSPEQQRQSSALTGLQSSTERQGSKEPADELSA